MAEVNLRKVVKRYDDVEVDAADGLDVVVALDDFPQRDLGHWHHPLVAPAVRPAM